MVALPAPQFSVSFGASGFAPGTLTVTSPLRFEPSELAHALFVTGRAPGDQATHGAASVWEFVHRTSLIPSYIRMSAGGRLVRSRLALELDRSEKVALSYAIGQAMTGIFCRRALSVSHLMHVDRYAQRFGVTFGSGRKRPDLFGQSVAGWVVAEAKGRSNGMESDLRGKLEQQKRSISAINGSAPTLAVGCVASFPPDRSSMFFNAFDPVDDEPDSIRIRVDSDRFLLAYYEPFATAVRVGNPVDSPDGYVVSEIGPFGLSVGLLESIYSIVSERAVDVSGIDSAVADALEDVEDGELVDGTLVQVDWSEALATRDRENEFG